VFQPISAHQFSWYNPVKFYAAEVRHSFSAFLHLVLKHETDDDVCPFVKITGRKEFQIHVSVWLYAADLNPGAVDV
jgi:hypothetical protein